MPKAIDLTGQRFGKLLVLERAEDYVSPKGLHQIRWKCKCDCGNITGVCGNELKSGRTKSCGCFKYKYRNLTRQYVKRGINDLASQRPDLLKKWDYEKNNTLGIYPDKISYGSNKKVWWKCPNCNNSWSAVVESQGRKQTNGIKCPYCARKNRYKEGINDLASQYSNLLKEWDYEKNNILGIFPNKVSYGSNKKVWWICSNCGYEYQQSVVEKTSRHHGCPNCNLKKTSFPEQALYYYVKQIFSDAINSDNHLGVELDIYIPSLDVAIEYDGEAWHNRNKKIKADLRKNQLCIDNNIELIRVREPNCIPIDNCTVFYREDNYSNLSLDIVISDVLRYLTSSITIDVDITRDTPIILSQYATKQYENSLSYCYPDIAKEWHPTKNGSLTPDKISYGSNKKVWWLGKCGHEWQTQICIRTRKNKQIKKNKQQDCPYCNHRKIIIGYNDLQSQYPKIAEEWHPIKNGDLKPTDFMSKSSKKVWWLCKCGHEWQAPISRRTTFNNQCLICYNKSRSCSVICIETNTKFESVVLASKSINSKTTRNIYQCCRGESKTAGGYHWKFADDNKNEALIS